MIFEDLLALRGLDGEARGAVRGRLVGKSSSGFSGRPAGRAFSLVELLVVIAVIGLLMALIVPTLTGITDARGVTQGAEEISGILDAARAHAIANNTYTWVGFYEHSPGAAAPYNQVPPYSGAGGTGIGIVKVAAVASKDGTKIFENADPTAPLPPARLQSLSRVRTLTNIHIADLGAPPSGGGTERTLEGRPGAAYEGTFNNFNRISSESADKTRFAFTVGDVTFQKTIRFNPLGESNINSTYSLKRVAELGIKPTRGDQVLPASQNFAAIQVAGITGEVEVYRK